VSDATRVSLVAGFGLSLIYLGLRTIKHGGITWPFTDFLESVSLSVMPFPIPGAADMVVKAIGQEKLPIFDSLEDRVALGFGGALLIAALGFGILVELKRGTRPPES
jgi:hypothetical protein